MVLSTGLTVQTDELWGLLQQFYHSSVTGPSGHAGGPTYHTTLRVDMSGLLVAVNLPHATNTKPLVMGTYVQCAERLLIWRHLSRHGKLPFCNTA